MTDIPKKRQYKEEMKKLQRQGIRTMNFKTWQELQYIRNYYAKENDKK